VIYNVVLLFKAIGNTTNERDDDHKVDEMGAVLPIIEKVCLTLLVGGEALPHACNSFLIGMMTVLPFRDAAARCLEETTVATKDFILLVPCHTIERRGSIYNGAVVSQHVYHDKRTRHINGTEIDGRILSIGDAN